nr:PREDICTED: uncharacterized protein LOC103278384 isoform X2 [Anolis carolinensis]|eukprot:XP_008105892.1 PREDICTED: uncharacterized protein LOC103278384 isoform X2 [Anolis carolinensis]
MTTLAWCVIAGQSQLVSTFLLILLGVNIPGNEMLEIYYPADSLQLQEGDSLVLTCTIMYQRYESQGLDVYWCKQAENVFVCDRIDKEMEKKSLNESSNPKENDTFSILLQIHQLSQSDSGNYRCQGTSLKPVQFVMGHYITVHVTATQLSVNNSYQINTTPNNQDHFWREAVEDFQRNKAFQVPFQLEKMLMPSLILVLIAFKRIF